MKELSEPRSKGIKSALNLIYYESAQWPRTALRTAAISSSDESVANRSGEALKELSKSIY